MSEQAIRAKLEGLLLPAAAARSVVVALENDGPLTPPDDLYLRATLLPAPVFDDSQSGDHQVYAGIFQIDVMSPLGVGAKQAADAIAWLRETFVNGAQHDLGGLTLRQITPLQVGPGITDATRYMVPVRLTYRADTVVT